MRTASCTALTVSSSSASPWVAEVTPPGLPLKSTPPVIVASRNLCARPAWLLSKKASAGCASGIEAGRHDGAAAGVHKDGEVRKHAVGRPRHPLLLEHLVDQPAHRVGIAVGGRTGVGRAHDFECRDPGRGGQRVGVEGALMGDLLAVGGLGHLKVEEIEDVLAADDRPARQAAGEDLGQGRHVGPDAVFGLGAARLHAETGHHLVKDQQNAMLPGQFAQRCEKGRLGPGQGADSEQVFRRGAVWSGVDLAPQSVARIAARLASEGFPTSVSNVPALMLPFPDNSFDLVILHGVIRT
jgi:hypothetical protein